jgi:predicted deacylase
MGNQFTIGTAKAKAGSIQYGEWPLFQHPTGHTEFLPVVIAQGAEDGPCLWLTAAIHGNEHSGPLVLHRLIEEALVAQLKGTIVAIPALNPAGMRTEKRVPYHDTKDPNRLWPDGKPEKTPDPERKPPSVLERAYARLFEQITDTADFLIDFHNAWPHSIPFAFQDRVLFRPGQDEADRRREAEQLSDTMTEMLEAFGHTIIREYPVRHYFDSELHRSTSAAVLLLARKPAFTVELGTQLMPTPSILKAAVAGTRNVLRWAGMLAGSMEKIEGIKVVEPGFPVHRSRSLRAVEPCVVDVHVQSGDIIHAGDALADLRDIWGRPLKNPVLVSEHEGIVLSPAGGILFNAGQTIVYTAIKDESPLVCPYPEDYFKIDEGEQD